MKIHVRLGSGWCALTGGSLTARQYAVFVAAGPLASLAQALVGLWLAASAEPGSDTQWVLFAGAIAGALALTSLVPMDHRGRSDGQRLLEVGGWISGGPRPEWYPPPDDPHVATSVAPPG